MNQRVKVEAVPTKSVQVVEATSHLLKEVSAHNCDIRHMHLARFVLLSSCLSAVVHYAGSWLVSPTSIDKGTIDRGMHTRFISLLPFSPHKTSLLKLLAKNNRFQPIVPEAYPEISDNDQGMAFEVELSKRAGIDWGADLSFRWVKVIGMDPGGEAYKCNLIEVGDYIIGLGNTSTIAQDFDYVLSALNKYPESRYIYVFMYLLLN